MEARKILGLIGGLLILVALVIGFIPVSSQGANCGSAFVKSDDAFVSDLVGTMAGGYGTVNAEGACDGLRSIILIPVAALLVIGGALGAVAMVLASRVPPYTPRAELS